MSESVGHRVGGADRVLANSAYRGIAELASKALSLALRGHGPEGRRARAAFSFMQRYQACGVTANRRRKWCSSIRWLVAMASANSPTLKVSEVLVHAARTPER
jgi:hypothetical protein